MEFHVMYSSSARVCFLLAVALFLSLGVNGDQHMGYEDIEDYHYHRCTRHCVDGDAPMVCEYDFLVEHYHTLTRACHNCPMVQEECYRPHCVAADGALRGIITVNRQLPGPPIRVCEGDTIRVRVHNKLEMGEGVTIHWHGVLMKGTPYMDGVPMVTQCATPPHTSFTYTFTAANPGTHFWHAHSGMQRAEGVFGKLIIRQPPGKEVHVDKYDLDMPKHEIMVHDWWPKDAATSFAYHHHSKGTNKPENLLINGKGIYAVYHDPKSGRNATTPREEFVVRSGVKYRFRLISNALLNCPIRISVDSHMISIIASDGQPVEPMEVESFTIFAGERYDFILTANQNISNYLLRARGLADCGENHKDAFATAILRYEGAPSDQSIHTPFPKLTGIELNPLNTKQTDTKIQVTELKAMAEDDPATSGRVDKSFTVGMDFYALNNPRFHHPAYYSIQQSIDAGHGKLYSPQMNHITMEMPSSPALSQLDDIPKDAFCDKNSLKYKNCKDVTCECTHTLKVDLHDVVEVIIVDEGNFWSANHPVHLHGHGFRVVAMDKLGERTTAQFVDELDAAGNITRNLDRPPIKDTVTVPDGGYTIIRFYADNPGFWFFHCHIAYHSEIGMGLLFQVGDKKDFPKVPARFPKCGSWDSWNLKSYDDDAGKMFDGNDGDSDGNNGAGFVGVPSMVLTLIVVLFLKFDL